MSIETTTSDTSSSAMPLALSATSKNKRPVASSTKKYLEETTRSTVPTHTTDIEIGQDREEFKPP